MKYIWKLIKSEEEDFSPEEKALELKVPPVIAQILSHRKIDTYQEARDFFRPHFKQLIDPFLMKDMDKAVKRLHRALRDGENILIYGDYDVDGVTGTSILYKALSRLGGKVSFFIPERQRDGYGLSENGIREARRKNISLIVSVDCGITAVKESHLINDLDMDLIVCDHHHASAELPDAVAILDPKRDDCSYPFERLAGCGVAFKFMQALYMELNEPFHKLIDFLELVAVGSSADIVPIVGENRVMVKFGLEKINTQPGIGLKALLEISRMQYREINPSLVVFFLAPRINAVGRMGDASRAVHLMITSDTKYAQKIARLLEEENRNRRSVDEVTFAEAQEIIESNEKMKSRYGLVLYKEDWHIGVVGIVASRIAEMFNRPTVLLSIRNGIAKGSARSIPGVDIFTALTNCKHLFKEFGGHKYAAGVTIEAEKLKEFTECFDSEIKKINPVISKPSLEIDCQINLDEVDAAVLRFLKMMKPFGPENMRPLFISKGVSIANEIKIVGKNHLKFKVKQNKITVDCIFFNALDVKEALESRRENMDIVFSIEENTWNGTTTIQFRIQDFE